MKALPAWQRLSTHYPAHEAGVVAGMIGGKVKLNYDSRVFTNFCAIRVSRALNLSGHQIPYIKDQTSSGSDGRWYIFRVRTLIKHLEAQYGKPDIIQPAAHKTALKSRRGIIIFEVNVWTDASGHADLWDSQRCLWKGYADVASKILFWAAA